MSSRLIKVAAAKSEGIQVIPEQTINGFNDDLDDDLDNNDLDNNDLDDDDLEDDWDDDWDKYWDNYG